MSKLKIFLDVDNTIINSTKAICEWYADKYDHAIKLHAITNPDWTKVKKWDFSDETPTIPERDIREAFDSDYFFDNVEFFDGAKEVLTKLTNDERFEIIFCSIGTVKNISNKMKFLEEHFPNTTQIMLRNGVKMDKSIVNMEKSVFVDDNQDNLFSSNAKYNVCFSYDNDLDKDWNSKWKGLISEDWLDVLRLCDLVYSDSF